MNKYLIEHVYVMTNEAVGTSFGCSGCRVKVLEILGSHFITRKSLTGPVIK